MVPFKIKQILRTLYYGPGDLVRYLFGQHDELWVPKSKRLYIGGGDFTRIGNDFFNYFINIAQLKPTDTVLDMGCGIGRIAIPLTKYLRNGGRYEGIDIVPDGIKWCTKNISSKFNNFNFQVTDIYNKKYNPEGRFNAKDYVFPFADECFDFIFLTSLFTHMFYDEVQSYLGQIARVLKNEKNA